MSANGWQYVFLVRWFILQAREQENASHLFMPFPVIKKADVLHKQTRRQSFIAWQPQDRAKTYTSHCIASRSLAAKVHISSNPCEG
ncbi:hypothetical protein C4D60_Mb07t02220 [Musa balbisiana]|uniref:Uncharacterized protein n=1 Tax=Musa balbisiana TaxID=52838 RepID=A0A4S8JCU8_MUSBA|nr:hypothetical protein C4D60_Mb07t02220 [Musa balbisiana]